MLRTRTFLAIFTRSSSSTSSSNRSREKPFPVLRQAQLVLPDPPLSPEASEAHRRHQSLVDLCRAGGGPRGIERHTKTNRKILIRDRIAAVVDDMDDFFEIGTTAGVGLEYGDVPCAGFVVGISRVRGVYCMVVGSDGTVKGGTTYPITLAKSLRSQDIARRLRLPTVIFVDSGGAFLPLQSEIFPDIKGGGRSFRNQAVASSEGVPHISLVCGLCTAGGAYIPTMSDEAAIVDRIGNIYLAGPPLVKAATGEVVTGEELGGATLHCSVSGITDHFAADEEEGFAILRDIVSSLNIPAAEEEQETDSPLAGSEVCNYISGLDRIGKEECYALLAAILDGSRFSEFKRNFGGNLITGFGFVRGVLTGLVMNCGDISAADGQKGAHFAQLCDGRDIPMVFLQNGSCSSFASNQQTDAVAAATLKERAKFAQCHATAQVPKIAINVGGIAGDELMTMCGPSFDPWFNFAWPGADMSKAFPDADDEDSSSKSSGGGVDAPVNSAQFWAARGAIDGVILPADTRAVIAKCLQLSLINYRPSSSGLVSSRDEKMNRTVFRM